MLQKIIKRIYIVIFIIGLLISNYSIKVEAKEPINFKNITIEDGLTQGTVEALFQDSKGYIWIGTNDGLNRFNGYKFKVYSVEENEKNSIVNNYILDIKEDAEGNIWVATANGLSKILNDGYSITNYIEGIDKGNLTNSNTTSILITKENNILVATAEGLNIYNKKTDSFEKMPNQGILATQYINSITEDDKGNIWAGCKEGLYKLNINSLEIKQILSSDEIEKYEVYKVYYDKDGYIWAGTYGKGAYKIDIKTEEFTRYYNEKNNEEEIGGNYIKNFLRDSSGVFWIATEGGLSKYDEKNNTFITYRNKIYDRNSLVDNNIYSMIEDRTGLIWLGTYAGISLFNPKIAIQHFKNDPFDERTINDNMISALYEDKDELIWIGTRNNGVNIFDRKTDEVIHIITDDEEIIESDDILDITGNEESIFIATANGVSIINKKEKTIRNYNEDDGIANNIVRSLLYDELGCLWIGTTNGLVILNLETSEIIDLTYLLDKYLPKDRYIGEIYKDKDGEYWIGSFVKGGLLRINPKLNKITVYKNKEGDENSISNDSIRCIVEGQSGEIWIGTSFGLNKFNKEDESFISYTTKDGIANNTIYGILIDSYGNPWFSSNMGISKLNLKTDTIINFDLTDGLQSNEFNGNSYFKNKNGEFLFGGINGFNIINPESITKDEYKEKVVFDRFEINGNEVGELESKKLQYFENNIYIEVFVPIYKNTKNIQYYYLLEGGSDEWQLMNSNSITLSNLSSGKYTFRVKARSNNGTFIDEAVVNFTIKPPVWFSNIAFLVYIIAILLLVIHNKNKMRKLDRMVNLRTKELNEEMERNTELFDKVIKLERRKNNYLINLSHELRTPLNVIYSTEQLIRELNKGKKGLDKDNIEKYMLIIRNNTKRLLKIINDLIDTSKIEHGSYKMNIKEINIVYVVEEAALSLRQYIESKGITLIIDPDIEEKIIEADENEIERCIVNIVNNAYKFTNYGGYIKVEIKDLDDEVKIEISDNGIGIDKENYEVIFNRFNQIVDPNSEIKKGSGLGLTITKKIIDLHQGKIYVESQVGKGSKFIIILPTKQNNNI